MKSGLCSVTLRRRPPQEIVRLVQQAGLDGIEWAGDVHVPPGDFARAAEVRRMTEDAGLAVSSYGSYWKAVGPDGKAEDFSPVLESALALGTDTVRIWAGRKPSDAVTAEEREIILGSIAEALEAGERYGIKLALEFHGGTLADHNAAAREVLDRFDHENLYTYWQPMYWLSDQDYRLQGLNDLAGRVLNLHVFHWLFTPGRGSWAQSTDRRPLAEGAAEWNDYLRVDLNPSQEHYALLEFVRGDMPAQFLEDAGVLKKILQRAGFESPLICRNSM